MKYLLALILGFLIVPFPVKANIIPEGQHSVENFISITDTSPSYGGGYEDYNFYLVGTTHAGGAISVLLSEQSQAVYFNAEDLIAVKKIDTARLQDGAQPNCPECGDSWFKLMENTQYVSLVNLYRLDHELNIPLFLPDTDPTVSITQVIGIAVAPKDITAEMVSTTKEDGDGTKTTMVSSEKAGLDSNTIAIGLLVGVGILGLVLAAKTLRK